MQLSEALPIAEDLVDQLAPHCQRISIAGSVRRRRPEVNDIEIVAIPNPYDVGLFESGIAPVVEQYPAVKGQLPCKYTRRILPQGIHLDLFFATRENWGVILAIRTGSADWVRHVLAARWVSLGYHSTGGILEHAGRRTRTECWQEEALFHMLGMPWVDPTQREWP